MVDFSAQIMGRFGVDRGLTTDFGKGAAHMLYLTRGTELPELLRSGLPLRVWSSKPLYKFGYRNQIEPAGTIPAHPHWLNSRFWSFFWRADRDPRTAHPRAAGGTTLFDRMEAEVAAHEQGKLLHEIEMPLAQVLAVMECEGFSLDSDALRAYGEELEVPRQRRSRPARSGSGIQICRAACCSKTEAAGPTAGDVHHAGPLEDRRFDRPGRSCRAVGAGAGGL